jgi:hypothetical protein
MRHAVLIVLCLLGAARPAAAQEPERPWARGVSKERQDRALALFKEGNAHFEEGRYREALAKYREAIPHWDHPAIRYNIAVCLVHLDQPLAAYEELEKGLAYDGAALAPALRNQAYTYRKLLRGQLAELKVVTRDQGADVRLDGRQILVGPGEVTQLVTPGAHQLVASKKGYLTESRSLSLFPDKTHVETLELVPLDAATNTRLVRRWARWKPWAVLGAGAGVALLGVPLQLKSRADMKSYDDEVGTLCPEGCPASTLPGAVRDEKSRAELENAIAVSAFATGGAVLVTGAVLLYLNQPRAVTVEKTPGAAPRRVSVAPGLGSLSVTFTF